MTAYVNNNRLLCILSYIWLAIHLLLTSPTIAAESCEPGDACYIELVSNQLVRAGVDKQTKTITELAKQISDQQHSDQQELIKNLQKLNQSILRLLNAPNITQLTAALEALNRPTEMVVNASTQNYSGNDKQGETIPKIGAGDQLQLDVPIADYYHPNNTNITALIITVPDPRIPRLKRDFDITANAISSAFSKHDYSLDRYYYPWGDDGPKMGGFPSNKRVNCQLKLIPEKECENGTEAEPKLSSDFGVMTFRRDDLRTCDPNDTGCIAKNQTSVIAVYLVGERPTTGVPVDDLSGAVLLASQNNSSVETIPLKRLRSFTQSQQDRPLIIGPTYSGSVQSVLAVDTFFQNYLCKHAIDEEKKNCDNGFRNNHFNVWSPTATAGSNSYMANEKYRFLAIDDFKRKAHIKRLTNDSENGVCLVENSTYGEQFECPFNHALNFTPSIWETGLSYQADESRSSKGLPSILTGSAELQFGRDGGNEFPASYDPNITGRSQELQIQQLAYMLSKHNSEEVTKGEYAPPIRYVLILASDVKDRLYLSRFTKNYLPNAQLIFMESDILLSHPGYMDATRGAWMMSGIGLNLAQSEFEQSISKKPKNIRSFPTETSAQFHQVIDQYLTDNDNEAEQIPESEKTKTQSKLVTYVVTRDGFRQLNSATNQDSNLVLWLLLITALTMLAYISVTELTNEEQFSHINDWVGRHNNPMLWFWGAALVIFAILVIYSSDYFTEFTTLHFLIITSWLIAIYLIRPWSLQTNWAKHMVQLITISAGFVSLFWVSICADSAKYIADGIRATDALMVALLLIILTIISSYREKPLMFTISVVMIGTLLIIINLLGEELLFWHPFGTFQGRLAFNSLAMGVVLSMTLLVKSTYSMRKILLVAEHYSHKTTHIDFDFIRHHHLSPIMAKFQSFTDKKMISPVTIKAYNKLAKRIIRFRRELVLIMLSPLSIVLMVYLTPVYLQNNFLIIGLSLLTLAAIFSCFSLIRIDGNQLLRNLFCVKGSKTALGVKVFTMVLLPVLLVVIGLAIVFIPGVAVWTDGFLMKLVNLRGH